jgi:ribosomal protein S19
MKSKWKIQYYSNNFEVVKLSIINKKSVLKLFNFDRGLFVKRQNIITQRYVGKRVQIHTGYRYISLKVKTEMLGFVFGSFIFSKKIGIKHLTKKKT